MSLARTRFRSRSGCRHGAASPAGSPILGTTVSRSTFPLLSSLPAYPFPGINGIVRDLVHHSEFAISALQLARSAQREFERCQRELAEVMAQLEHGYGGAEGVAFAAEIAPEQREAFAKFWKEGEALLPACDDPPAVRPNPRANWARQSFDYYVDLESVPFPQPANEPGGDPGQSSSHRSEPVTPAASAIPSVGDPDQNELRSRRRTVVPGPVLSSPAVDAPAAEPAIPSTPQRVRRDRSTAASSSGQMSAKKRGKQRELAG